MPKLDVCNGSIMHVDSTVKTLHLFAALVIGPVRQGPAPALPYHCMAPSPVQRNRHVHVAAALEASSLSASTPYSLPSPTSAPSSRPLRLPTPHLRPEVGEILC